MYRARPHMCHVLTRLSQNRIVIRFEQKILTTILTPFQPHFIQ